MSKKLSGIELAKLNLKIGSNAFGGWSTTYFLFEKEFSKNRRLITKQQLETAAASGQALPGPAQVIVAAQLNYYLNGKTGAYLGTAMYLLPSLLITLLFSFIYFTYLSKTNFADSTLGLQAAVGGVIIGNALKLAKHQATSLPLWFLIALAASASYFLKVPALLIVFGAGLIGIIISFISKGRNE